MTDLKPRQTSAPDEGPDVKHMKWWGWGVDGVAFHHEDKPAFAPFVKKMVGVDLTPIEITAVRPSTTSTIPASRITADVSSALSLIVGEGHVVTDDMERVVHTYGKSIRDLIRDPQRRLPARPRRRRLPGQRGRGRQIVDAVVEHDAVLIPFGGGSNIVGSSSPCPTEERIVVSLDMGRLDRVLDIDDDSTPRAHPGRRARARPSRSS